MTLKSSHSNKKWHISWSRSRYRIVSLNRAGSAQAQNHDFIFTSRGHGNYLTTIERSWAHLQPIIIASEHDIEPATKAMFQRRFIVALSSCSFHRTSHPPHRSTRIKNALCPYEPQHLSTQMQGEPLIFTIYVLLPERKNQYQATRIQYLNKTIYHQPQPCPPPKSTPTLNPPAVTPVPPTPSSPQPKVNAPSPP